MNLKISSLTPQRLEAVVEQRKPDAQDGIILSQGKPAIASVSITPYTSVTGRFGIFGVLLE